MPQFVCFYFYFPTPFKTQLLHIFNGDGWVGMECGKETVAGDEIKAGGESIIIIMGAQ
jgi:hypothetical protein